MKRAVSSMDASAQAAQRGSPITQQYRLKRCKSAFANLKRLGNGATTTRPATASCYVDESSSAASAAAAAGEEATRFPRWCQFSNSPEMKPKSPPTMGGPFLTSRWPAETTALPVHHQSLLPPPQLQGGGVAAATERRLFSRRAAPPPPQQQQQQGGSGGGEQEGVPGGVGSGGGGGSSGVVSSSRKSSRKQTCFPSSFTFTSVPEHGEISTAAAAAGGAPPTRRCPFLQHQLQQQQQQQQHQHQGSQAAATAVDAAGGGLAAPAGGSGGDYARSCWIDPGSPGFSIVGFGDDETAVEEEGEEHEQGWWSQAVDSTSIPPCSSFGSPATAGRVQVSAIRGRAGFCHGNGGAGLSAPGACGVNPTASAWPAANPMVAASVAATVAGAVDEQQQQHPRGGGGGASGESPSSPMLLLRLQRRFEEMLLVSNVAT